MEVLMGYSILFAVAICAVTLGLIVRGLLRRREDVVIPVPSLRGSIFPAQRTSIVLTAMYLNVYILGLVAVLVSFATLCYTGIVLGGEHIGPIAFVLIVGLVLALS